jgi:hypothetical protein
VTLVARNAESFHADTPDTGVPGGGSGAPTGEGHGGGGGGGGGGGPRWITIATFSMAAEAHLARLKLENEGVACVIVDEHLISTNWLLSPAIGGIKLQVPEELAGQAREVLGTEAGLRQGGVRPLVPAEVGGGPVGAAAGDSAAFPAAAV